jgi:hypothetical protein
MTRWARRFIGSHYERHHSEENGDQTNAEGNVDQKNGDQQNTEESSNYPQVIPRVSPEVFRQ